MKELLNLLGNEVTDKNIDFLAYLSIYSEVSILTNIKTFGFTPLEAIQSEHLENLAISLLKDFN